MRQTLFLTLLSFLFLTGCSGGSGSGGDEPNPGVDDDVVAADTSISGVVQKGVFSSLNVQAVPVDQGTGKRGTPIPAKIQGQKYSASVPPGQYFIVEATGEFTSESTGETVSAGQPLKAIFQSGQNDQTVNVNVATHLVSERVEANLSGNGNDLNGLIDQANDFVTGALGMSGTDPAQLQFENIDSQSTLEDPDLKLLLLSASITETLQGTDLFAGGFGSVVEQMAQADNESEAHAVLGQFNGLSAGALYQDIRANSGFQLPPLDLIDSPVWNCRNDGCIWLPTFDEPTVSVTSQMLYEADGEVSVHVRLGKRSDQPVQVRLYTESDSAIDGEDFVGTDQTLTIPANSFSTVVRLPIIVDAADEPSEKFRVKIESQTAEYNVTGDGTAEITIRNGAPADLIAGPGPELNIRQLCVNGVGAPETLPPGCIQSLPEAAVINTGDVDAGAITIDLEAACDSIPGCSARRDWLVDFYLVASDVGTDQAETRLGSYRYVSRSVQLAREAANPRLFILALSGSDAAALMTNSISQGWNLRLEARIGSAGGAVDSVAMPTLVPVPDQLIAGDREAAIAGPFNLAGVGGIPTTCSQGDYQLGANYSLELGEAVQGDACVDVSVNTSGEVEATLVEGEIDLSGSGVVLPARHVMLFGVPGKHPFPVGGDQLLVAGDAGPDGDPAQLRFWLHAEGLPIMFRLAGGALTPAGIRIDYDTTRYVMSPDYSAQDVRSSGVLYSNDTAYQGYQGKSGSLVLKVDGISTQMAVAAGNSGTAFPKAQLGWDGFTQTLSAGRVQSSRAVSASLIMNQSSDCREADCAGGNRIQYQVDAASVQLDPQGFWLGTAVTPAAVIPGWGARSGGDLAYARPGDLPAGAALNLALPGYLFRPDAPPEDVLLAHLQSGDASGVQVHTRGSSEARAGNFAPVGLSVGPETYSGVSGQPAVGQGQDLTGKMLDLDNQVDRFSLPGAPAVKYVLRNGGVTGAFNADPGALQSPLSFYGYDLDLERFAIRLVNNELDPFTWIDGNTSVAGDADIDVVFDSLQIDCGARFGDANVIYEACDASDNNANGYTDENCGQRLSGWSADTEVFAMTFRQANGAEGGACSTGDQLLTLDHQVEIKALNGPVALQAGWSPLGKLTTQTVGLQDSYRMDRSEELESPGYPIVASGGSFEIDNRPYGVFESKGAAIGVPFWNALSTDLRLANVLNFGEPTAEPSVVVASGDLDSQDSTKTNAALQDAITGESALDVQARYDWGNTGFNFTLPVYFTPESSGEFSRFIGRRQEADLFVLEAGAGINYIEPVHTKLSFGASADIEKLKSVNFQVDLNDPRNLGRVDDLLQQLGILNKPLLEPTFGEAQNQVSQINRFANKGLDDVMREGLGAGLKELGEAAAPLSPDGQDPFVTASEALAQVKSFPQQLFALLEEQIQTPVDNLFGTAGNILRNELTAIESGVTGLSAGDPVPDAVFTGLDDAEQIIDSVHAAGQGIQRTVTQPVDRALALVDRVEQPLARLEDAVARIGTVVERAVDFSASQCQAGGGIGREANGYLDQVFGNMRSIRKLLNVVEQSDLLVPLVELAASDPEVASRIQTAQQALQGQAEELVGYLDGAEQAVLTQICGSSAQNVLADVKVFIDRLSDEADTIRTGIVLVRSQLNRLSGIATTLSNDVLAPLSQAREAVKNLRSTLETGVPDALSGQIVIDQLDFALQEASGGRITELVSDPASETDLVGFVFTGARAGINSTFEDVRSKVLVEVEGKLPGAYFTPEQLRSEIVSLLMASGPVANLRQVLNEKLAEINRQVNQVMLGLTDQINFSVKGAIAAVESEVNEALGEAQAVVRAIPLQSAGMDGYAVIAGSELERAHIAAEWTMSPASEGEEPNTFGAALDAVSWSASNKTAGCSIPDGESRLDVTLSTGNIPARIASADVTLQKLYMGFTLAEGTGRFALAPMGVFGGIYTVGDIGFSQFVIYDPGFVAGIGDRETYVGARAGALFSEIQAEVAFLAGRTCNQEILEELDPNVAKFIPLPPSGFFGAYARGAASFPVITSGCPLTVGVGADFGAWVLAGPPATVGGLVGGGAYGKVACVGALRGQVKALGQVDTDGNMVFMGEGFGAAGVGSCEPASWTSRARSRDDSWCATGDALFRAGYNNGWSILDLSAGAIY